MSHQINHLYRIDIGFDKNYGYGAAVQDVTLQRTRGVKGNSIEQLMSRLRHVIIDDVGEKRHFPLEHEPSVIIKPNGF